jgi:hypothetical protein
MRKMSVGVTNPMQVRMMMTTTMITTMKMMMDGGWHGRYGWWGCGVAEELLTHGGHSSCSVWSQVGEGEVVHGVEREVGGGVGHQAARNDVQSARGAMGEEEREGVREEAGEERNERVESMLMLLGVSFACGRGSFAFRG